MKLYLLAAVLFAAAAYLWLTPPGIEPMELRAGREVAVEEYLGGSPAPQYNKRGRKMDKAGNKIHRQETAVKQFLQLADTVALGRGPVTLAADAREKIGEAAAEILRLWAAMDVALEALDTCATALETIQRIKEVA